MASLSATPAALNLACTVANDFTLTLAVTENGSNWSATGATLATSIYDSAGNTVATNFTSSASDGLITLTLTDTQTSTLGVGVYSYRLSVTKSSNTRTWIAGTLSVVEPGVGGRSASASLTVTTSTVTLTLTSLVAPLAAQISVADSGGYYTGTTVETVLAELPGLYRSPMGGLAALKVGLNASMSTAFGVLGDSTGNASDEWVYLFAQYLASKFPAYTVNHRLFNATSQTYDDAPTVIQSGAAGERFVVFDGSTGSVSYADSATTSPTGDLEIIVRVAPTDWTPATEQTFCAKFGGAGQRSFRFYIDSFNGSRPTFEWSADGTTLNNKVCPSGQGWSTPVDGTALWLRVTLDVDNGASGNTVTWYTATTYGTWTQVGQTITAGTTSVFDSTTALQAGARGGVGAEGARLTGKIGHVEIRNGIAGEVVAPVLPELWTRTATGVTYEGAPILTVVNGSASGAGVTYLSDATRVKKLTPDYGQAVTIISCSHNDTTLTGVPMSAAYDTLLSGLRTRLPLAVVALCTQNPRISPATNIEEHALRSGQQAAWAKRNSLSLIDAFSTFVANTPASLIGADGIHPNTTGSALWASVVQAAYERGD